MYKGGIKMNEKRYAKIKEFINSYKYGSKILNFINKITTSLVYLLYPVFLLSLLINKDKRFWKLLLIPGISFLIVSFFRRKINAPRPYEVLDIEPIIKKSTRGQSFPSRHVFSVYVIAMSLYYISAPVGISLMLVGIVVSLVRVLGGVHFPRDVIGGAIIGILFSYVAWNIF